MPFQHARPEAQERFLAVLVVPGLILALLLPWTWVNILGGVVLLAAVFFVAAFAWERAHPSRPPGSA